MKPVVQARTSDEYKTVRHQDPLNGEGHTMNRETTLTGGKPSAAVAPPIGQRREEEVHGPRRY